MAMKFALPLLFTLALTAIADAAPPPVAVTKVGDAVLDERGMTLCEDAWFGRAINGQAFQQDGITSFRGYQYATYFVTDHPSAEAAQRFYLAVARRKIDGGRWEVANLIDADFHNGKRALTSGGGSYDGGFQNTYSMAAPRPGHVPVCRSRPM